MVRITRIAPGLLVLFCASLASAGVNAESEEPVWRGWAAKTFGENPSRALQKVDKFIRKMFQDFPPR